ncbi:glycosyltransferase [Clostridium sp. DL1XJH146]
MKKTISIIVPVYNVAEYLTRCIESLRNQSFKNLEIILVDDGSLDNSLEICRSYEKMDPRIIVIEQENSGLSSARNTGMEIAKGKYILFVDSDDYIDLDSCLKFISVINNRDVDIVVGNGRRKKLAVTKINDTPKKTLNDNKKSETEEKTKKAARADYKAKMETRIEIEREKFSKDRIEIKEIKEIKVKNQNVDLMKHTTNTQGNIIEGKEYLKKELRDGNMYMTVWLNLYNRLFLLNNGLEFKLGLLHEDEEFTPRVFLKAKRVIGTDIVFYNYIIRKNSISNRKDNLINAEHVMKICKELEEIYKKIYDEELRLLLMDNLVDLFLNAFQVHRLYRRKCRYLVDKSFLKGKAHTRRNKFRVMLFMVSGRLYYMVNSIKKIMLY